MWEVVCQWVRSFSFPGSTPVCGGFFFLPGRTWVIICTRSSCGKKLPHTGFDPGNLNERTQYGRVFWSMDGAAQDLMETPTLNILLPLTSSPVQLLTVI